MMLLADAMLDALRSSAHFATGWDLRSNLDEQGRVTAPALDVRILDGAVMQDDMQTAHITVQAAVTILVPRGSTAATECDAAFAAVIGALHGLSIRDGTAGNWTPLKLQTAQAYGQDGQLAGLELMFSAKRRWQGVPCMQRS